MAVSWSLLGLLFSYITSSEAISCLVVRPGYGLQSEACPPSAVGCRIRVMRDRIDWYEWAKLYDRNQLVCVYPEEYKTESGCQRKASGSIRCWCGGSDDCNDAENSKALYEAFVGIHGKNDNQLKHNRVKVAATTVSTTTTTRNTPRRITPKKITARTTTTTAKTTTQTTQKKTNPTVTTTTQGTSSTSTNPKDFPTVAAHPLPTDEDKDKYDEIFAETRKQLEEQMKEEDERLKTMLEDEAEEMAQDDPEEDVTEPSLTADEEGRLERRERARQEERRRQEEEERLARIDREEAEEAARKTRARTEEDEEEEDYESFGLTSSACLNFPFIAIAFLLR